VIFEKGYNYTIAVNLCLNSVFNSIQTKAIDKIVEQ